jgi:hypothetical protein
MRDGDGVLLFGDFMLLAIAAAIWFGVAYVNPTVIIKAPVNCPPAQVTVEPCREPTVAEEYEIDPDVACPKEKKGCSRK